jgi:hypothetical protein
MGDGPTVQVARLEVESNDRAALRSTDELDAEIRNEGNVESKGRRLGHAKPYSATPLHVNLSQ